MWNSEIPKIQKINKSKTNVLDLYETGNDLLSQGAAPQVPSALKSLTAVFGMGTGVASSPSLPDFILN